MAHDHFSGARAKFLARGTEIATATGVSGGDAIEYAPVRVLNNMFVKEWEPVGYDATLACAFVRLIGSSLRGLNLYPKMGPSSPAFLQNIFGIADMICSVEDTGDSQARHIADFQGVRVAGRAFAIAPRALVYEDVPFVAKYMTDEGDA